MSAVFEDRVYLRDTPENQVLLLIILNFIKVKEEKHDKSENKKFSYTITKFLSRLDEYISTPNTNFSFFIFK